MTTLLQHCSKQAQIKPERSPRLRQRKSFIRRTVMSVLLGATFWALVWRAL